MITRTNLVLGALLAVQVAFIAGRAVIGGNDASAARGLLLPKLDSNALTKIEVQSADSKITLERDSTGGAWKVVEAQGYPADTSKVESTLRDLAALQISGVISTTKDHHVELKVTPKDFERRVVLTSPAGTTEIILGTAAQSSGVHARLGNEDRVVAVRDYSSWKLSVTTDAWIDRNYVQANRQMVQRAAFKNSHGEITLVRETPKDWALIRDGSETVPADPKKVEDFLGGAGTVTLSSVAGKTSDVQDKLGEPVATMVLAVGTPPAAEEKADDAKPAGAGEQKPAQIKETITLRIYPKAGAEDRYYLLKEGAEFVAETSKWNVDKILAAQAAQFAADEFAPPAGGTPATP